MTNALADGAREREKDIERTRRGKYLSEKMPERQTNREREK
jgi:hypothetical protein